MSGAPYVAGKKHGMEIDCRASHRAVITILWVDGKIDGTIVERNGDGDAAACTEFVNGV